MNSLLKNNGEVKSEGPETFLLEFEKNIKAMDLTNAELTLKKLKFLGLNFDPFQSEATQECRLIMDNLGLTGQLQNPYLATNILLRLMDKTEERVNSFKQ